MLMESCNQILERLSLHLDGKLPDISLNQLRQQAAQQADCLPMFEAMLWVHQAMAAAPMLEPRRDFSVSVQRALAWQRRREKWALSGILLLAVVMTITPVLLLAGAGLAAAFDPSVLAEAIHWLVSGLSHIASVIVAAGNIFKHMPAWAVIPISTLFSISLLLLSIIIVMQKAPEQLLGTASVSR